MSDEIVVKLDKERLRRLKEALITCVEARERGKPTRKQLDSIILDLRFFLDSLGVAEK